MRLLGFFLTEDDGIVLEQLLDPGQGGVGLRTDKTELKNLVCIAANVGLDGISVDSGFYDVHHGLVISRTIDQLTTSYSTGLKFHDVFGGNKMR